MAPKNTIISLIILCCAASACTVSMAPPAPICERFWEGDAVALVEAEAGETTPPDTGLPPLLARLSSRTRVKLRVIEVFRGSPPLEIIQEDNGGCGPVFPEPGIYLVHMNKGGDGEWSAYGSLAAAVPEDLQYAQAMKQGGAKTVRIFGTLDKPWFYEERLAESRRPPEPGDPPRRPIRPLPDRSGVKIIASNGNQSFETVVRPDHSFDLSGLPPGDYKIEAKELPKTLGLAIDQEDDEPLQLKAGSCKQLWLYSGAGSTVSGRVHGTGETVGFASIHLVPLKTKEEDEDEEMNEDEDIEDLLAESAPEQREWVLADDDGSFIFHNVKPGKYVLGFELNAPPTAMTPYLARYYPNTTVPERAKVFDVKEGKDIDGIDFALGNEAQRREVFVTVKWDDGTPAVNAEVYLRDLKHSRPDGQTDTDGAGEANLVGFAAVDYKVEVNAVCVGASSTYPMVKNPILKASPAPATVELVVQGQKCELRPRRKR